MKNILKYLGLGFLVLAFTFIVVVANPSKVFAATSPTISSIAPAIGIVTGGNPITITGTVFETDVTVTIDGVPATSVVRVSDTSITAVTPAGSTVGAKDVVVTNHTNPGTITLAGGFTYIVAPTAVDLKTAGNFAVFSNTAISSSGTTKITGDIGVGPGVTSTAITGNFALDLPAASAFSTSVLVTGKVYAKDYAVPTPAKVNTASNDLTDAYNAALAKATTVNNAGAGNLGSLVLVPGVYTFNTGVTIPTNLTLNGGANDVWIFQISGNLSIASDTSVLLTGGAVNSNVFWAVAGTTTLGTTSVFEGNILAGPDTSTIAMENGATLHGKALGQKNISLIANTIMNSTVTDILTAGVTGLVAPKRNATPTTVGSLTADEVLYTVTSLNWSPTDSPFLAKTAYTATVVLTSVAGFKFPAAGIPAPTTNVGGTVSAGVTGGEDASGNTLTFTELFSETGRTPSSGGSVGSVTSPVIPITTPALGCSAGNLFNTSTGAACVNNAVEPQGCSGGNVFNTSTGAVCTNNAVLQIPGCGNRATGFSTATGGSCVGNKVTTAPTTYDLGTVVLKNGSQGNAVVELQKFLNAKLNLGLVLDGKLGPKTIAVIKQWQRVNGLVADGLVGPLTKAKMHSME